MDQIDLTMSEKNKNFMGQKLVVEFFSFYFSYYFFILHSSLTGRSKLDAATSFRHDLIADT